MYSEQERRQPGQDGDMEAKETGQRCASHIRAAAQKNHDPRTDDRHLAGDLRTYLSGEKSERVPRQEIAAEPESESKEQQDRARDPGQFPRLAVRAERSEERRVG